MPGPGRSIVPERDRTKSRGPAREPQRTGDPYGQVYLGLDDPPEEEEETEDAEDEEEGSDGEVDIADEDEGQEDERDLDPVAVLLEADEGDPRPRPPRVLVCESVWGTVPVAQNIGRLPRSEDVAGRLATYMERLREAARIAVASPRQLSAAQLAREMDINLADGFRTQEHSVAKFIDRGERVELANRQVPLTELMREGQSGRPAGAERQLLNAYLAGLQPEDRTKKGQPKLAEMFADEMVRRGHNKYSYLPPKEMRRIARMVGRILASLRQADQRPGPKAGAASRKGRNRQRRSKQ